MLHTTILIVTTLHALQVIHVFLAILHHVASPLFFVEVGLAINSPSGKKGLAHPNEIIMEHCS